MQKYRIKTFDVINNIHILQQRFLWIFWTSIGVGKREILEAKIQELGKNK